MMNRTLLGFIGTITTKISALTKKPSRSYKQRLEDVGYDIVIVPDAFCCSIALDLMNDPYMIDDIPSHAIDKSSMVFLSKNEKEEYLNPHTCEPIVSSVDIKEYMQSTRYINLEILTQRIETFVSSIERIEVLKKEFNEVTKLLLPDHLKNLLVQENINANALATAAEEEIREHEALIRNKATQLIDELVRFIETTEKIIDPEGLVKVTDLNVSEDVESAEIEKQNQTGELVDEESTNIEKQNRKTPTHEEIAKIEKQNRIRTLKLEMISVIKPQQEYLDKVYSIIDSINSAYSKVNFSKDETIEEKEVDLDKEIAESLHENAPSRLNTSGLTDLGLLAQPRTAIQTTTPSSSSKESRRTTNMPVMKG